MKVFFLLSVALAIAFLAGCEKECACTMEERFNFCLTYRDNSDLPDELLYLRETEGRAAVDTLHRGFSDCFFERPGKSRVLVRRGDSLVSASPWVKVDVEDCCHAKATTVDLDF